MLLLRGRTIFTTIVLMTSRRRGGEGEGDDDDSASKTLDFLVPRGDACSVEVRRVFFQDVTMLPFVSATASNLNQP
jgi:hypothetical protein